MKNDTKRWWGWIRETNSEQIRWAYAYLRKKNMAITSDRLGRDNLPNPEAVGLSAMEMQFLISNMKKAWDAKQGRTRKTSKNTPNPQQALNVYISRKAIDRLDASCLQQKKQKKEFIEKMIFDASDFYDAHQKNRDERRMLKARIEELEQQLNGETKLCSEQQGQMSELDTPTPPKVNHSQIPEETAPETHIRRQLKRKRYTKLIFRGPNGPTELVLNNSKRTVVTDDAEDENNPQGET